MEEPTNVEQMTDILDLKGIHLWDLTNLWIFLAVLGVVLLVALLIFFLKRHPTPVPVRTPKTPLEQALEALKNLDQRNLVAKGQVRIFYFELSEIFRNFLEQELDLMAKEATLEELKPLLKTHSSFNREVLRDALWFLELSDLAKFAKWMPAQEEITKSVQTCRALFITIAQQNHPTGVGEETEPDVQKKL